MQFDVAGHLLTLKCTLISDIIATVVVVVVVAATRCIIFDNSIRSSMFSVVILHKHSNGSFYTQTPNVGRLCIHL